MKKKTQKKKTTKSVKKPTVSKKAIYKKCVQAVLQMAEDYVDFGDCADELLDEIAALKKQLESREQMVISSLVCGCSARVIEIDEASPGSELSFKI